MIKKLQKIHINKRPKRLNEKLNQLWFKFYSNSNSIHWPVCSESAPVHCPWVGSWSPSGWTRPRSSLPETCNSCPGSCWCLSCRLRWGSWGRPAPHWSCPEPKFQCIPCYVELCERQTICKNVRTEKQIQFKSKWNTNFKSLTSNN